ncbi:hypothetical protein AVEN_254324-1 [Araneus ventricosus]|uniref:Uncharacterized protein n=1 Tax=Araneus ventricosus TaxID=182803 RepID=A0A4Y2RCE8_ARAVE|nr:hypothetical protein AVEN_254324-1 [Araneus ventricosus]
MLHTDLPVSPLSHSACQRESESCRSCFFRKIFGNGRLAGIPSVVASFARVSAISLPFMPKCALTQPSLFWHFPEGSFVPLEGFKSLEAGLAVAPDVDIFVCSVGPLDGCFEG